MVSQTRNITEDIIKMYEVISDLFPGIEECVHTDLRVREDCTEQGLINTFIKPKSRIPNPLNACGHGGEKGHGLVDQFQGEHHQWHF